MLIYSIFVFAIAAVFIVVSVMIYRGKTSLIHSYHQTKVADKTAKAFAKALFVLAVAPFISGIVGLFGDSDSIAIIAVLVLIVGIGCGIGCIVAVQKKYNKGIF